MDPFNQKRDPSKEILSKGKKMLFTLEFFPRARLRPFKNDFARFAAGEVSTKFRKKYKNTNWGDFDGKTVIVLGCKFLDQLANVPEMIFNYRVRLVTDPPSIYFSCHPRLLKFPKKRK